MKKIVFLAAALMASMFILTSCEKENELYEPQKDAKTSISNYDFTMEIETDRVSHLFVSDKQMEYLVHYENYGNIPKQSSEILFNDYYTFPSTKITWLGDDRFITKTLNEELIWDCSFAEHSLDGFVQNKKGELVSISVCAEFVDFNKIKNELQYNYKKSIPVLKIIIGIYLGVKFCDTILDYCMQCSEEKKKECRQKGLSYEEGMCCGDCVEVDGHTYGDE